VADGCQERARRADGDGEEERVRRDVQPLRQAEADRRGQHDRGCVVDQVRQEHREDQDDDQQRGGRELTGQAQQPVSNQLRAAGRLQRLAHRNHRAQQDDDGPVDARISLLQRNEAAHEQDNDRKDEGHLHRDEAHRREEQRRTEDDQGRDEPLRLADAQLALGQRKATQGCQHVFRRGSRALQEQHVARSQPDAVEPRAQAQALPRNRQQVHAVPPPEVEAERGLAHQQRVRGHHRFHEHDLIRFQVRLHDPLAAHQLEPRLGHQVFQVLGVHLQDQDVARREDRRGRRRQLPHAVAHQPQDVDAVLHQRVDVREGLAGQAGVLRQPHLGHVLLDLEQVVGRGLAAARGNQPPPDQYDEEQPGQRHPQPDRREVEHAERGRAGLCPERGSDDVRRGADQRGHAAKQRGERERHEKDRGRNRLPPRDLDGHRHDQRQRADVVHERGERRNDAGERGQLHRHAALEPQQPLAQQVHHAGILQAAADDQHRRHGDHGRVAEPAEDPLGRNQAGQRDDHQREQGNHVIAPAPRDEEQQSQQKNAEDDRLLNGHDHFLSD